MGGGAGVESEAGREAGASVDEDAPLCPVEAAAAAAERTSTNTTTLMTTASLCIEAPFWLLRPIVRPEHPGGRRGTSPASPAW
jgi:hypothetical protein